MRLVGKLPLWLGLAACLGIGPAYPQSTVDPVAGFRPAGREAAPTPLAAQPPVPGEDGRNNSQPQQPAQQLLTPDLVGLSVEEARAAARARNLRLNLRNPPEAPQGAKVVAQVPRANTPIRTRGVIAITIGPVETPPPRPTPRPAPEPLPPVPDRPPIVRPEPTPAPHPVPAPLPATAADPAPVAVPIPAPDTPRPPVPPVSASKPPANLSPAAPVWPWGILALAILVVGLALSVWHRKRRPLLPVRIALIRDAGRGRAVIGNANNPLPRIAIRFGRGTVVARVGRTLHPG